MLLADMSNVEMSKETMLKLDETPVSPNKSEKQSLVELKNGKIYFCQKPLSCEKMSETMQEIVQFRAFLENRGKQECSPLQTIPDEHVPLIAKLVHESDKTIAFLAKRITEALLPGGMDADADSSGASLTTGAIEGAILQVCDRVNYGIDWTEKATAATSIWRWEVKEHLYDMLPRASRDKLESRLAERRQAKQDLKALLNGLPQSEKEAFTKGGKKTKTDILRSPSVNDENNPNGTAMADIQLDAKPAGLTKDDPEAKRPVGRPKKDKAIDPERLAKEKEKAERKAAKEERERKQQEAVNKSRSIMTSFFSKPKTSNDTTLKPSTVASSMKSESSSSQSEFEKSFKPFVVRKGATLAPISYFQEERKAKEVIVIDQDPSGGLSDGVSRIDVSTPRNADGRESFGEYIRRVSSKRRHLPMSRSATGARFKTTSVYCIRDIFAQLSEAEVLGDDACVRSLQAFMRARDKIPAKVLIFHEDYRPGYFGTFTKSSTVVGPRTPFAKDAVAFDYNYDSGEDWEEEEEGADDLLSLTGSDAEKSSDVDADEFDDWLVDDDEPIDPGTPLSERADSPSFPLPQDLVPKRKAPADEAKEPKKRKVMPLVPFSKGPCLEVNIGECEYEPFNQYRIHLFNDTPFPIDPFKFVSTAVVAERNALSKQVFIVPALPQHVQASNPSTSATVPTALPSSASDVSLQAPPATPGTAKRMPMQPKNPFPPALLPYFADKVASLNSGSLTWLVESLYQDLRPHRVKKNAIEAKVREDCEKCPIRKIWVVKEDVLRSLGKTWPPVPST